LLRCERLNQRRLHTAGVDHRNTSVETYHRDMGDLVERAHNFGEAAPPQHKGIAPGDDDLPDFRPLTNVVKGRREGRSVQHRWLLPDDLAAKAKPAINRA